MTVAEVEHRVQQLALVAHDNETAHTQEDDLYEELLEDIANGTCVDPRECAREALKTKLLPFRRWYG